MSRRARFVRWCCWCSAGDRCFAIDFMLSSRLSFLSRACFSRSFDDLALLAAICSPAVISLLHSPVFYRMSYSHSVQLANANKVQEATVHDSCLALTSTRCVFRARTKLLMQQLIFPIKIVTDFRENKLSASSCSLTMKLCRTAGL